MVEEDWEWKRAFNKGSHLHFHILNSKTHLRVWLGNALLSMLVKFGNFADAWYAFGRMEEMHVFLLESFAWWVCKDRVL